MATNAKKTEKMVSINLPRISGESNAVFVSVGPRQWLIKRGVTVQVPQCVYDVLCDSQMAEDAAVSYIESAPGK